MPVPVAICCSVFLCCAQGGRARCPRCGEMLAAHKPGSLDRTMALTVAAAIAFTVANVMPLMGLSFLGPEVNTTVRGYCAFFEES